MPEEHIERLRGVFKKLSAAGLRLKPSKCEFFKPRITYLGHTGGFHLSWIFWEHENLSGLSIIQLIQLL